MLEDIQGMLGSVILLLLMQTILLILILSVGFMIWRQEKEIYIYMNAEWEPGNEADDDDRPWGEPEYRDDK